MGNLHGFLLIIKFLIPIVMIVAGLIFMGMRIPGWSMFIGLPLFIIGSVFIIYAYDDMSRKHADQIPPKENQKKTEEDSDDDI